jgi:hypothetical protein
MNNNAVQCVFVEITFICTSLSGNSSITFFFPGNKVFKSLLINDGALLWIVKNAIRRHIELALCHLAQHGIPLSLPSHVLRWHDMVSLSPFPLTFYSSNLFSYAEVNSRNIIISEGALWELFRISRDCSREAITLFVWLISHRPTVLFSQNKSAISNQPTVLFSQNKPAPAISHQPTEHAVSS